jgi:hypothetical protein
MTQVLLETRPAASNAQDRRPSTEEQLELYGPDGKQVATLGPRSGSILIKAQPYTLICMPKGDRQLDNWRLTRGPFALDLSRPGRYTLTVDLGAKPAADSESKEMDAAAVAGSNCPPAADVVDRALGRGGRGCTDPPASGQARLASGGNPRLPLGRAKRRYSAISSRARQPEWGAIGSGRCLARVAILPARQAPCQSGRGAVVGESAFHPLTHVVAGPTRRPATEIER